MELLLTDEQRLLQDSFAKALAARGGLKRTRELRNKGDGIDAAVHRELAGEGWLGLLVPPEKGGLGLGLTELALMLEQAGRALAPEPIGMSAVAAGVLAAHGKGSQADAILGRLVAGEIIVAPAIAGGGLSNERPAARVRASVTGGRASLDGLCDDVPMPATADGFLVAAQTADGAALWWVPRGSDGLTIAARETVDGRRCAQLGFEGVKAESVISGPGPAGSAAVTALFDQLLVASAAELVGVMAAALDMTVEYLKTRRQFGKPIGSFQALQHRAVDDFTRIVSTRSFLHQVCGQGAGLPSAMASALKAHASAEALAVTKSAIQMHGAIGFTDEHDVGLYLKRAMWLSAYLGNAAVHRRRYAGLDGR